MDHVAVLVLDTPIKGIAELFGDFGDNTVDLLADLSIPLKKYQIAYSITGEDDGAQKQASEAVLGEVSRLIFAGSVKGVVLTGSRTDCFATNIGWVDALDDFIKNTLFNSANLPIIGLCFGHQILAKNMDCKVDRNTVENGWEMGTTTIALNKSVLDIEKSPFRKVLTTKDGIVMDHINLMEFHRDIVYGLPVTTSSVHALLAETSFHNIGSTPKCSIQGLVTQKGPLKVLTFQGHPEFSTEELLKMLEGHKEKGDVDQAQFEKLTYNSKNLVNQGYIMAQVIVEFIETYRKPVV